MGAVVRTVAEGKVCTAHFFLHGTIALNLISTLIGVIKMNLGIHFNASANLTLLVAHRGRGQIISWLPHIRCCLLGHYVFS